MICKICKDGKDMNYAKSLTKISEKLNVSRVYLIYLLYLSVENNCGAYQKHSGNLISLINFMIFYCKYRARHWCHHFNQFEVNLIGVL